MASPDAPATAHSTYHVTPGDLTFPGATPDATGVNFVLSAPDATKVELCLFDAQGKETRLDLLPRTVKNEHGRDKTMWSAHVEGLTEGQHYGYRVHGPYDPYRGHRFNPNKLLIDPYAKAIDGEIEWRGTERVQFGDNEADSAPFMPRCRVVDWQKLVAGQKDVAAQPTRPLPDRQISEAHVRGATMQNPDVPEELRGTYAGLASDTMIDWFKKQGINTVEVLPVHTFTSDGQLQEKGLTNYWGYMTLNYFSPHAAYAATDKPEQEFADMVKKLRQNGIDVVMDVVYNHTCEGSEQGPTLSYRGIDNFLYRLDGQKYDRNDKSLYYDTTGCGNSLDFNHPDARKLVVDSLEYFANLGVSGFRFDLGVTLGREGYGAFDPNAKLFQDIQASPVLKDRSLIWEPWDVGHWDSYQLGNMPRDAQWNGKYRDYMRQFWATEHGGDADMFTTYFAGSDQASIRNSRDEKDRWRGFSSPQQAVNFVTAHDGSTLRDLVTYSGKRNWANGENNNDGDSNHHNGSGFDGETTDPHINAIRQSFQRAMLATTMLSQGAPMIPLGHESGKSQGGNTNVWCQDNPTSWNEWGDTLTAAQKDLQDFSAEVAHFRDKHAAFRRLSYFTGRENPETGMKDFTRLYPDGREIPHGQSANGQAIALMLSGENDRGVEDTPSLLLVNGSHHQVAFKLPDLPPGHRWQEAIDTHSGECQHDRKAKPGDAVQVSGRSMVVFESVKLTQNQSLRAGMGR